MYRPKESSGFKYRPRLKKYTDGKNNWFDKDTMIAVSYNWWTYFKVIKGKRVFNDYSYSQTTSRHQSNLRDLLKTLRIKIDVVVSTSKSLDSLNDNVLKDLYFDMFLKVEKNKTCKHKYDLKNTLKAIKVYRSLGLKCSKSEIKVLKEKALLSNNERLDENREIAKQKRLAKKELQPELKSLDPIDIGVFNELNNLKSINF